MTGRKEVELDQPGDAEKTQAYKDLVARAQQRRGEGIPVGGAPPLKGAPDLAKVQDAKSRGQQMPEQERPYTIEEFQQHQRSGQVVPGIGAAYPSNQRTSLGNAPKPGMLRDETKAGLEAMAEMQEEADRPKQAPSEGDPTDEGSKTARGLPSNLDPEFLQLLMGQQIDQLQRRERRDAIEGRCKEIDLRHIVLGDGAEQTVPIIPDLFEPRYRTLSGHEDTFSKKFAWEMCHGEDISQMYYDTILGLTNVVLSIVAISGEELPEHRTKNGEVDEDIFVKKFEDILKRPVIALFDLWTNYNWFVDRIRSQLDSRALGNG